MALAQIRQGLLQWYDENHRVLPWRRNFHSKRASQEGDLPGAPLDLPLDEFMYYVMVCEVHRNPLLPCVQHLISCSDRPDWHPCMGSTSVISPVEVLIVSISAIFLSSRGSDMTIVVYAS